MELAPLFLTLGALFLVGLLADTVGRKTRLPRVTLLLGCGIVAGSSGLDLLPAEAQSWYDFLAISALTMVAFLLGGALKVGTLREHGAEILFISAAIVVACMILVTGGLWLLGFDLALSLILAAIATATAPAATQDVIRQSGVEGPFVDTLKGIVAIDDVWGLLAFSVALVVAGMMNGHAHEGMITEATWEIGGALILGIAIGLPAAYLTGRLDGGEPLRTEALGIVFLTAGLALRLEVSFLIAGMTAGVLIVNRARHHTRAFHEIENIQWPFMILFFVIAGASLELHRLSEIGLLGAAYVALRTLSRIIGGWVGGTLAGVRAADRMWYGIALLPQAGVAVGMALVAAKGFPEIGETILTLTIGTTILFEILGPAGTLIAIRRVAGPPGAARNDTREAN